MKNILIQITQDQHESEERFLIGFVNAEGLEETEIVNVSSLTESEKKVYNNFLTLANSKITK